MKRALALVLALTACVQTSSRSAVELSGEGRAAFDRILVCTRFSDGAVGEDGATPDEVFALRVLWREPAGADALRQLARDAALGGRLYALCGLYYADPSGFRDAARDLRESKATVGYQSGCTIDLAHSVRDLVELHRPDVVRLERQDQTIKAWKDADPERFAYDYDIVGGGFPNLFRDDGGYR